MRSFVSLLLPKLQHREDSEEVRKMGLDLLKVINSVSLNRKFSATDGLDYSEFSDSGMLVNSGSARTYNDLPPIPMLSQRQGSSNNPALATFVGNTQQLTFAVGDYVYGNYELMHEYAQGTDLLPHIHMATNSSDGTVRAVRWELEYTLSNAVVASDRPVYSFTSTTSIISAEVSIPANTTAKSHIIVPLPRILAPTLKIGAYLVYRVRRIAATGGPAAPASDPFGLALGVHILQNTQGSEEIGVKTIG